VFEGLRVVDLSDRHSGAFVARLFGDYGADVVVTTAADPRAGALGEGLRSLRADAVNVSITANGLAGPLAGRAGNNLTLCARSGWTYINGCRDEPPLQLARDQAGYVGVTDCVHPDTNI
jgi:crotonobetainyl-CoA:carnitine CoA-transferase CaiB-like acyl-CoA transferase